MSETPNEKRRILYGFASTEKFDLKPPPPRPPKNFYPRIPKFWQLRGTPANSLMHYWALGFVGGSCVIGAAMMYFLDHKAERLMKLLGLPTTSEELHAKWKERDAYRVEMNLGIRTLIPDDKNDQPIREKVAEFDREAARKADISRPDEVLVKV